VRSAENIEDLGKALFSDNLAHTDDFGVFGGHPHRQVTLSNPQNEVKLFLALDDAGLDCLDECGPVVGVDNGLADTENHRFETPFAVSRVTRGGPGFLP
jgi:hypothetical protein